MENPYMPMLTRFDDVVLDLRKVVAVTGNNVLLEHGNGQTRWIGVGAKTADAIRNYISPELPGQNERPQGTGDTAPAPSRRPTDPASRSLPASEAARARLQCPSSPLTSSPADGSAGTEDGTVEGKGKEKGARE